MPSIRTAAVAAVIFSFAAAGAAAAQDTAAPGKPLPLLQVAQQGGKAKLRHRPHGAAKATKTTPVKTRLVRHRLAKTHELLAAAHARHARPAPEQPATSAPPANVWPAVDAATPGVLAMPAAQASPINVVTAPVINSDPNEIATDSHNVQPPVTGKIIAPDPAADDQPPVQSADDHAPVVSANGHEAVVRAAGPGDPVPPQAVVRAMVAAPAPADPQSPVGSASWIAHVLAALGGAIAAGVVAWFLIGPAPRSA